MIAQSPLHNRLSRISFLDPEDLEHLELFLRRRRCLSPGDVVVTEGMPQSSTSILTSGWAIRFKTLEDGRRQILNFLVPGDIVAMYSMLYETSEHTVAAIGALELSVFPSAELLELFRQRPRLAVALCWLAGQDERVLEEQIVRIGRRHAVERMAHLMTELRRRLLLGGCDSETARRLPVRQFMLADALGMSTVHANRSFRYLVKCGAVGLEGGCIVLRNPGAIARIAGFDGGYLESDQLPSHIVAAFQS